MQGTGLGDGQADNATTDDLESEDVFDGAEKPKKPEDEEEENEEQDEKTKEEDGVEMSGDLDSQMQVSSLHTIIFNAFCLGFVLWSLLPAERAF